MATLATTVNGIKLPNPFVIGSGPPGTNANVIGKAIEEGWGAVIIKTISLDSSKVVNVAPRYARLRTEKSKEVIGWQNIELISDRPFKVWIDELNQLKDKYPDGVEFSYEGFPIFDKYATHTAVLSDGFGESRDDDFKNANQIAGLTETPATHTWHHKEDGKTLVLVDRELHAQVRHWGGVAITKILG